MTGLPTSRRKVALAAPTGSEQLGETPTVPEPHVAVDLSTAGRAQRLEARRAVGWTAADTAAALLCHVLKQGLHIPKIQIQI